MSHLQSDNGILKVTSAIITACFAFQCICFIAGRQRRIGNCIRTYNRSRSAGNPALTDMNSFDNTSGVAHEHRIAGRTA